MSSNLAPAYFGWRLLRVVTFVILVASLSTPGFADDLRMFYTQQTQVLASQAFQAWQHVSDTATSNYPCQRSASAHASTSSKEIALMRQQAVQRYLNELVPATKPSPIVAHIPVEHPVPVDPSSPEKRWTQFYAQAKNGLRPHVEYTWKSNADIGKGGSVAFTPEHIQNLQQNFDILMWYRNELDSLTTDEVHRGGKKFKLFLDCFVADLLRSLPDAPRIDVATGAVDSPKWLLNERSIRDQVIMTYRYLVAKYQIYPEYHEFGPADREVLMSMMKIAFLMGVHFEPQWFDDLEINLREVNKKSQWKKPMGEALELLKQETETQKDSVTDEDVFTASVELQDEPCVIVIPKPQPKVPIPPKPEPKADEGDRIEIIVRPKSS